ncbi:MAG: tetratricopeptide repeat protein [bacterium]
MEVFQLHIESVGSYQERTYKLTLKQGEFALAVKEVAVSLDDLLFNEIAGMRGVSRLRKERRDTRAALAECGNYLFDQFLSREIYDKLSRSKQAFVQIINESSDPKLAQIPWDIAALNGSPLISKKVVFSASPSSSPEIPQTIKRQLRVLLVGCLPEGMPPFSLEKAVSHLKKTLGNFPLKVELLIDVAMYGCTKEHLAFLLQRAGGYHIIHYLGYGGKSKLLLEAPDGSPTPFYGEELVEMLEKVPQKPLLLFLDSRLPDSLSDYPSYQSLKGGRDGGLRLTDCIGFAQEIMNGGQAAAVVSMRQQVTDAFAEEFINELYYRLLQHNLSLAESFNYAQISGLANFASQWYVPALAAGESANQYLEMEKGEEETGNKIRFNDQEHTRVIEADSFVGRHKELSLVSREFIFGDKNPLLINGVQGAGKTALAARICYLWKTEFAGVFIHHFSSSRWLIDFWDSLVDFCFHNHLSIDIRESSHPFKRYRDLSKQLIKLVKHERFLFVFDNMRLFSEAMRPEGKGEEPGLYIPSLVDSLIKETSNRVILVDQNPAELENCPGIMTINLGGLLKREVKVPRGLLDAFPEETQEKPVTTRKLPKKHQPKEDDFYQAIAGLPLLVKIFNHLPDKINPADIINDLKKVSRKEYPDETGYHTSLINETLKSLYAGLSPDQKMLSTVFSPYNRELPLYLVLKVMGVSEFKEINGFYDLFSLGLMEVSPSDHPTLEPTVCLHNAYRDFLNQHPEATTALFSQEIEMYLRKFGAGFSELAEWLKTNSVRKNILDTYLNSWEYLLAGNDLDKAVSLIEPIKELMLKEGFIPELKELLTQALEKDHRTENQIRYIRTIADLYSREGVLAEALAKYEESLKLNRLQNDNSGIAADLLQIGAIKIRNKLFVEAQQPLKESLALLRELKDQPERLASVLSELGESYRGINDLQTALDLISESAKINQEHEFTGAYVKNIHQLADILLVLEKYPDALDLLGQALIIERKLKNKPGICEVLRKQAEIEHKQGNLPQALDLLNQVLNYKTLLKRQQGVASTLLEIGAIKREQEATAESRKLIEQGLEISRRLQWEEGLAKGFHQAGLNFDLDGHYNEAVMNLERSLKIYQKLDLRPKICEISLKLAEINEGLSDYSRALELCQQAMEIREKRGDVAEVAEIVFKCADIHYLKKNYQQASENYERCLEAFRHQNNLSRVADAYHQLATVAQAMGHSSEALKYYRQCLETHEQMKNQVGVALSLAQMGRIMEREGKLCQAIGKYASSLAILRHLENEYVQLAAEDLASLKKQMPEAEFKWCVTAGLEEHTQYLTDIEIKGRDF